MAIRKPLAVAVVAALVSSSAAAEPELATDCYALFKVVYGPADRNTEFWLDKIAELSTSAEEVIDDIRYARIAEAMYQSIIEFSKLGYADSHIVGRMSACSPYRNGMKE
jgi:hypothetical protein